GRDILGCQQLPFINDEVVDVGWRFVAAGNEVQRVSGDEGGGVGGVVGAVGDDGVAFGFDWSRDGGGRVRARDCVRGKNADQPDDQGTPARGVLAGLAA